ncbi:MFS general substrate transporter [Aaosphaeria arxii CBS 175.79]|uniref:MFS general substrate transporter n=1 Tax=Aaosphaeria arxii CBS 175.79 TaxID=1450172 RepID=A0A6A5XZH0_9PLEO|nr:MFS general substrate transporter [Aaosphaeria arxii CBS 175.79]KAF2018592.1 MFS general substrate transporter [Aaosphaeria arxii CBS 175.79]
MAETSMRNEHSSATQHSQGLDDGNSSIHDETVKREAPEPPNGGVKAYLKIFGGFLVLFITLGVASTFGSYQAYYESDLLSSHSSSTISWIGTTQVFLQSFAGLFSGAFYDAGYATTSLAIGMPLLVLGQMMLSLSRVYWHIMLSQGLCIGIGSGLIYVPAVSIVASQFTTKRTIALGFTATGSAVGGIILPIMFRKLLPMVGFGWTNRAIGLVTLILASTAFILLTDISWSSLFHFRNQDMASVEVEEKEPTTSDQPSPFRFTRKCMADLLANLGGRSYLFLCMGVFFVFLGFWVPYFYIVPFASRSLKTSSEYSFYLLSILNAGSILGRVLPTFLDRIIGSAAILLGGATILSAIIFAWLGVHDIPGITLWCFFVGFASGIVVSIPNAVASRLSEPCNVGLRIGFMWTAGAFAELIGAPIAGALVQTTGPEKENVNYFGGQVFGGASIALGAVLLIVPAWSTFKEDRAKMKKSTEAS